QLAMEQGIVTVESDKASMELPADQAGKVLRVLVNVGDKVKQGTPLVEIEPASQAADAGQSGSGEASQEKSADEPGAATAPAAAAGAAHTQRRSAPAVAADSYSGQADVECDVLVLGAGPGGYSAA